MLFRIAKIHASNNVELEPLREGGDSIKVAYDQLKPHRGPFHFNRQPSSITVPPPNVFAGTGSGDNNPVQLSISTGAEVMNTSPDESGDSVAAPVVVLAKKILPISDVGAEQAKKRKHLELEDDDVAITGTTPAAARGPEPLPVTRQSVAVQGQKSKDYLITILQKENEWLVDDHIDHAQGLLLEQFPNMHGLQNRMLFGTPDACLVGTPACDFVQILNLGGNHWICVSTLGCAPGHIDIYDPLYTGFTTPTLLNEIARMLHTDCPQMTMCWQVCSKQSGGSDCGLFAVAFATAICYSINPSTLVFSQSGMRNHFIHCIHDKKMTLFPNAAAKSEKSACLRKISKPLFCVCRMPDTFDSNTIECYTCKELFHRTCVMPPAVNCYKCQKCAQ